MIFQRNDPPNHSNNSSDLGQRSSGIFVEPVSTYLGEDWGYNIFEDLAVVEHLEEDNLLLHRSHAAGVRIDTLVESESLMHLRDSRSPGKT
jgi:hypothetical protein